MKKTKKILSLILAIIMIVSTMPMAFAYNFDYDAYMEEYLDFMVYSSNVYTAEGLTPDDMQLALMIAYGTAFNEVSATYPEIVEAFGFPEKLDEMPEAADAMTAALANTNATIEENIANGTFVVIIDTRKAISSYYKVAMTHKEEELDAFVEKIPAELTAKAKASAEACDELLSNAALDPASYTQDDYDAAAADMITYYTQLSACIDNDYHLYDVAVKDNNETHTKTCIFCTATETSAHSYSDGKCICGAEEPIVEEDTTVETPDNNNSTTDNEEEPAPQNFFQKIINFFKNLFDKIFGWLKK